MKRVAALATAAAVFALGARAVAQDATLDPLLDEAWKTLRGGAPAAARPLFEDALARAQDAQQPLVQSAALRGIAAACTQMGDYETARVALDEALPIAGAAADRSEVGRVLNGLGCVAWYRSLDEARALWERAIAEFEAAGDVEGAASTTANLLLVVPREEVDALLERGLALAEPARDRTIRARLLQAQGDRRRDTGDFAGANTSLLEARRLFEESGRRDSLVTVLNSLGYLYRLHGRSEEALAFQSQALEQAQAIGDPQLILQAIAGIGSALAGLGRHAEAVARLEEGIDFAQAVNLPRWLHGLRESLADIELARDRPARAAELIALVPESFHRERTHAWRYALRSTALRRLGRLQEALAAAEDAVRIGGSTPYSEGLPSALIARARCFDALGRNQEALRDGQAALAAIEALRGNLFADDLMRQGFGERVQDAYVFVVGILQRLGRHEDALEAATHARARAFLDRLAARPLDSRGQPVDPGPAAAATVADVRATARRLDSTVLVYFVGPDDAYVWAVGADGPVASAKVPASASRLAELVDGAPIGPRSTAMRGAALTLPTRSGGLLVLGDEAARWKQLYDLLVRPVRRRLPRGPGARLTVIPDGPLLRLPFGALRDGSGRYLVERYAIHYAPAVTTFALTAKPLAAGSPPRRMLLVGDPASYPDPGDGTALTPLPGSRRELDGIARLLGPARVELLQGVAATEARLRDRVGGIGALHFATHGVVRDDAPLESFVALSPGAGGARDDGRLTTTDVYGLSLVTDLVFLSACRTARGSVSADGVLGLTRAFFHAGTSSIVATLSDVVDEPAQRLVSDFYRARLAGADKAAALRKAQLAMLRDLRSGRMTIETPAGPVPLPEHPAFWAPFVLLGEP